MDISKQITEFLRQKYAVGASHARELAASFLGYKSHAAYLTSTADKKWSINDVDVLIPDLECLEHRLQSIATLPTMPIYRELAKSITDDLREQRVFRGSVILAKNVAELRREMEGGYLLNNVSLEDELSGEIAMSNSWFGYENYDTVDVSTNEDGVTVHATGVFDGEHDDESDSPNHGDKIDFEVILRLQLESWGVGFSQHIAVTGALRSNWS